MSRKMKRDKKGRFSKSTPPSRVVKRSSLFHTYCKANVNSDNINSEQGEKEIESWKVGRRIVEWDVLLNNLKFCKQCGLGPVPLTYESIKGELVKGLGFFLYVECSYHDCRYINTAAYGKTHRDQTKKKGGMPSFVVNTKLGTAMIDSLGGPKRANNMLTTLNLKTISDTNLNNMERRAGDVIELVSVESSKAAANEAFQNEMINISNDESRLAQANMTGLIESLGVCPLPDASPSLKFSTPSEVRQLLPSSSYTPRSNKPPPMLAKKSRVRLLPKFPCRSRSGISVAVDTAWQKKGFDSLTSHTFFMSTQKSSRQKKVVKTIVGHRTCGVCNWWRRKRPGQKVRPHRCVRNCSGSARSMEETGGVKGVKELIKEGIQIDYLEGDGDNTLISRLKSELNVEVKKRYDKYHVVKNFTKSLYNLKKEKGIKLSKNIICHLEKCLKYAFAKNHGDHVGMRENLKAIVPHQFSDHSLCQPRFCGYKRKPGEKYVYYSLPYKSPLHDDTLRQRLQQIFDPLINNAHHYIDLGSSQQCEHANKEVSLRAPKSHHYGNSASLDYRVHATAAFVNEGRHYISKSFEKMGLSPGVHTKKYATICMQRRLKRQQSSHLPTVKRRRLELKKERSINQGANEAMEGDMYQSGIAHKDVFDTELIPDPVPKGNFKPVQVNGEPTIIAFDLETTSLIEGRVMPQITQIAAVEVKSGSQFSTYVTPTVPISREATSVTGISVVDGEMAVNGQRVSSIPISTALNKMTAWLSKFQNVCLVAHNGRRFDFPILVSKLKRNGAFEKFNEFAFIDSISIFRKMYPKQSLKQVDLVLNLLNETYDAHNAMCDVVALGKLMQFINLSSKDLMAHSFNPLAVAQNMDFNNTKAVNFPTLNPLICSGVMKRPTAENISGSGLSLAHLQLLHKHGGEDAIRDVFTSKNAEGMPRVTNSKKILDEVIPKICKYFDKN